MKHRKNMTFMTLNVRTNDYGVRRNSWFWIDYTQGRRNGGALRGHLPPDLWKGGSTGAQVPL